MPIRIGGSRNQTRSSTAPWQRQAPYMGDIYDNAFNQYYGIGGYGGYNPYQANMQAGGAGGFNQNPSNSAMLPGGGPIPGSAATGMGPAPELPPWLQQGMQGSSQAFGSLVGATNPGANPFFQQSVNAALQPMFQNFANYVAPGLNMGAVGAGQTRDSSRNQIAQGLAAQGLMQNAGNVVANMGSQAYGQGLNAATAALQNNPFGATPWDHLAQYRAMIGDPVMASESRGRGGSANVGLGL